MTRGCPSARRRSCSVERVAALSALAGIVAARSARSRWVFRRFLVLSVHCGAGLAAARHRCSASSRIAACLLGHPVRAARARRTRGAAARRRRTPLVGRPTTEVPADNENSQQAFGDSRGVGGSAVWSPPGFSSAGDDARQLTGIDGSWAPRSRRRCGRPLADQPAWGLELVGDARAKPT